MFKIEQWTNLILTNIVSYEFESMFCGKAHVAQNKSMPPLIFALQNLTPKPSVTTSCYGCMAYKNAFANNQQSELLDTCYFQTQWID